MQQVGCSVVPGWPAQHICMSGVYSAIYSPSKWQWEWIFYLCVRPLSNQQIFIMALRAGSEVWQMLLTKIGIPADSARTYAKSFVEESITNDSLTMIDREVLKELGVTTMRHALPIL